MKSLDDFLGRYFQVTEEIQSSPSAASISAYQVVAKAYRRAKVKNWNCDSIPTSASAMMEKARDAGLKITYHIGESEGSGPAGMLKLLEAIHPDRIGHGIELGNAKGKTKDALTTLLREEAICLGLCPTVNPVTHAIPDIQTIARFVRDLADNQIPYCINTDNPYLIHTNLKREYEIVGAELGEDATTLLDLGMQHAVRHSFLSE